MPAVVYGQGKQAQSVCVEERELRRALTGPAGLHAILDLVLDGNRPIPAVLKDYQQHPVRGELVHVDFHEVRLDQAIQAQVTLAVVGEAPGTKEGGVLSQVVREVGVEALPMEVPEHIDVDVSQLHIGESLRVGDLPPLAAGKYLDDPDTVVVTITQPTRVEEPEEVLAEGEEVAGVPEGGEAPEGGAEAPLEPGADAAGSPGTAPG